MAEEREASGRAPSVPGDAPEAQRGRGDDQILSTFSDLVGDLAIDLSRATLRPALERMHEDWRGEAKALRQETAEWVARANASRQQMEQVVERQHELAQDVYNTHARLLQEMVEFAKERRDQQAWQEQVGAKLARLGELQQASSVESTRIAGIVRDIIGELARYQTDLDKRYDRFEQKVQDALGEHFDAMQEQLHEASEVTAEAMEALSKTNEETRSILSRDVASARREIQEVAQRLAKDLGDTRTFLQRNAEQRASQLSEASQAVGNRVIGFLIAGNIVVLAFLAYLFTR